MKIALVIHGLGPGGAERTLTTLANAWVARGDSVTLLSFDDGTAPPAFALDPAIDHRPLSLAGLSRNFGQAIFANGARIRRLRTALAQANPDVVISFITATNILAILATRGFRVPLIVSERVDTKAHRLPGVWSALRKILYRYTDAVVVQGEQIVESLPAAIRPLAHVIPNPVTRPIDSLDAAASFDAVSNADRMRIVGLGRLVPQKGFDLLIRAFAATAQHFPDWDLVIWGEGPERAALGALIEELGLSGRVKLPGVTAAPAAALASADIFILSSRYEGFPNALAEAMACGVAVIATDCPSGPSDMIRDNVDGLLVAPEDSQALADAIGRLASDASLGAALGKRAAEITSRYSVDDIIGRWNELIVKVGSPQ
ncbi:MAG: glycosyltransferase [Alphaproteobacteria bacterium]|nr:glycosyltransferase [Alphaproteobacteria bacterium]